MNRSMGWCKYISIHAPRTGSDLLLDGLGGYKHSISIHAPRTGSDTRYAVSDCARVGNFNPRSPHGERRTKHFYNEVGSRFQSTLPARGAT